MSDYSDWTITNVSYNQDIDDNNVGYIATINGNERVTPLHGEGNKHADEIKRRIDAGDITVS